jgi:hypothetical protein
MRKFIAVALTLAAFAGATAAPAVASTSHTAPARCQG